MCNHRKCVFTTSSVFRHICYDNIPPTIAIDLKISHVSTHKKIEQFFFLNFCYLGILTIGKWEKWIASPSFCLHLSKKKWNAFFKNLLLRMRQEFLFLNQNQRNCRLNGNTLISQNKKKSLRQWNQTEKLWHASACYGTSNGAAISKLCYFLKIDQNGI